MIQFEIDLYVLDFGLTDDRFKELTYVYFYHPPPPPNTLVFYLSELFSKFHCPATLKWDRESSEK